MKAFIQFVKKENLHIFRDFRTLLVLFGMPLVQMLIFGFAIRTEINDAEIGILDKSKDYVTEEIRNKLLSSGYFKLNYPINQEGDIEPAFKNGKVKQVIVFEPDFAYKLMKEGKATIQLLNDASNPNVASMLNSYTSSIIRDYSFSVNKTSGKQGLIVTPEVKMLYNPEMKSVFMFVPGLISTIMMLVCALMTSIAITKEKELGTMEVLLASPLKPLTIIIGKVIPYFFLALVNLITILLLALYIFGLPFKGSYVLFFGEVFLFIITALALGIFISTVAKTQQVAMMVALAGLMMPSIILSGMIFPIENMPVFLQFFSHIIPAKWFLIIEKDIMLKGLGFEYFWKETLILTGMCILLISLSVKKFKIRLE
jgi:ABC-2 type transport system permease protein